MKFRWFRKAAIKVRNSTSDRLHTVPRKLNRFSKRILQFIKFHIYRVWLLGVYLTNFRKVPDKAFGQDFRAVTLQSKPSTTLRFCVYTTLFGDVDELHPPVINLENVDFICFTDQEVEVSGWQMRKVASLGNRIWQAKEYKLLPHVHLPEYEASLFIDANRTVLEDVSRFVRRWLAHEDFAMRPHPQWNDCVVEAAKIVIFGKAKCNVIAAQLKRYAKLGLPRTSGLVAANFIWRKHGNASVNQLMHAWLSEIAVTSLRDQMSLCYLMWSTGIRPALLPIDNEASPTRTFSTTNRHRPRSKPLGQRISGRPVSVRFVYGEKHNSIGTTVMRSIQLADMLATRLNAEHDIRTSIDFETRDSIIVLSKNVLQSISEERLSQIRRKNIAVVADWVDSHVRHDLLGQIDAMIACSINSFANMAREYPKKKVAYIAHHVDPRIPYNCAPVSFSVGYFGKAQHAFTSPEIAQHVDFTRVDTITSNKDWMEKLSHHSMHYSIRPNHTAGLYKPFTKGFVAAQCGANIIVGRDESDAVHILGDDYPYMLHSHSEKGVLDMLSFARESFGGPEWRRGLEIMAASRAFCEPAYIANQFAGLMKGILR